MLCILNLKKVKASRSPATGRSRLGWPPAVGMMNFKKRA
jgi:hypothetical protein